MGNQNSFLSYYRCSADVADLISTVEPWGVSEFLGVGDEIFNSDVFLQFCQADSIGAKLPNHQRPAIAQDQSNLLPSYLDEFVEYLRCERYTGSMGDENTRLGATPPLRNIYYRLRPILPVWFRSILQGIKLRGKLKSPFPRWPVDLTVDQIFEKTLTSVLQANGNMAIPFVWFWPEGKSAAFIMTHDVEEEVGRDFCSTLMDIDDEYGFKASFQIVPEKRYSVSSPLLEEIVRRGFEVCVHDLNHDGNLYEDRAEFLRRARLINQYARKFGATGFRSGVMYRNLLWYGDYEFSFDMSVPNVAHLDPQNGGCCTIMPYFIKDILEIPVTTIQDYSLFHILHQYSTDLWKQQIETIVAGHGLVSFIVHPDYVANSEPQRIYRELLTYARERCKQQGVWTTLPGEINAWWRQRHSMQLVANGKEWEITGEGKERARIAYANLQNGSLTYSFEKPIEKSSTIKISQTSRFADSASQTPFGGSNRVSGVPHAEAATLNTVGISVMPHSPALTASATATMDETPPESKPVHSTSHKPLRIAMVSYSFFENDNRVLRYATTLAKRGDHVDVFSLRRESTKPEHELFEGVHVHRLQDRVRDEKSRFSYASRIMQFLFRAVLHVARHDRELPYDLLHIHSVPDLMVFSALAPRLRGTPVILDIHDILPEFYASKFNADKRSGLFRVMVAIEQLSAKFASHVIIANDLWRERLLSRGLAPEKCTVFLNSPDRSIFRRTGKPNRIADKFMILYPGSLNWHQGLDLAISAFAMISEQLPRAEFHIYGEGPQKLELLELIRKLGMEGRIFIQPMLSLSDVPKVMESADLGVVPKRKDNFGNEAFSTKILEFMAMGVPAVVADTAIDKFYFNDSIVKFFSGGDANDLARKMLELIQNPAARLQQVDNASRFVKTIDWDAKQQEYFSLVDGLVAVGKG
jgi:glycosyltransferase involved in cell wall biosynthesis